MNHVKNLSLFDNTQRFISWGWIVFIWVVLALLSTTTLFIQLSNGKNPTPWLSLLPIKLAIWLFWGGYAILVFHAGKRFKISRSNYYKGLLFHIPFCLFSVAVNVFFYAFIATLIKVGAFANLNLWETFIRLLLGLFDWYFIIYWAIIIVGYAFDYYQKYKEREIQSTQLEFQLIRAQLQALKMQLQPHFLFNTLNTIVSLVRQDEKKTAVGMLTGLSDLLRTALIQKDQHESNLKSELDFIRQYLTLEKKRFNDNIDFFFDIEETTLDAKVPSFMLQPIVENAIYHGLAKKIAAKKLEIIAKRIKDRLRLIIYNDGPQLKDNFQVAHCGGLGLANTMERLSQFYGNAFRFSIRNQKQGVEVAIDIPFDNPRYLV